jgi:hypothetical protein
VHTGNAAPLLVARTPQPGSVPLLVGADIAAYHAATPQHWLRVGLAPDAGQYWRIAPAARYAEVRIVLRQTARHPIAAPHDGMYFRNSILACFGAPPLDPRYLLAILNARLVRRFWHDHVGEAHQRSFPQIKVGQLRAAPFPRVVFATPPATRARLAAEILAEHTPVALHQYAIQLPADVLHDALATLADAASQTARSGGQIAPILARIDAIVEAMAGLAFDEIADATGDDA